MGLIIRQSLSNAASNYLGLVIGAINILIIYPRAFANDPEYFGLVQLIISYSLVMATFLNLGVPGVILRHFPTVDLSEKPEFLGFFILFPMPVLVLISLLLYFFRDAVIPFLNNEPVFMDHWLYLLPLAFLTVYFEIFNALSQIHLKTVLPVFIKEVMRRALTSILLVLYWVGWISIEQFLILFTLSMAFQFIFLIVFLYLKNHLKFRLNLKYRLYRPMLLYGIFMLATTGANFLVNKIDTLMVGKFVDLSNVAFYSIAFFIGSILNVPGKSLMIVTRPIISKAFACNRMQQVKDIYMDTALNLTIAGVLLFTLIWLNIDDLFYLLPENYREGKDVVLIIAAAQLFNLSAGQNGVIISMSEYYRFNMYALLFLLAIAVGVNLLLIPRMGITGAAVATFISLFSFNFLKTLYIKVRLDMLPYRKQLLWLIPVWAATALTGLASDFFSNPILNILVKSILATLVFSSMVYLLRISPQLTRIIRKGLSYVA